jgi:hypothetical protein
MKGACRLSTVLSIALLGLFGLCGSGPVGKLFSLCRSVLNCRLFDCDDEREERAWGAAR